MKTDRPSGMLLARACLCLELDCNTVFDSSVSTLCPGCGSGASYLLANWLNGGGIGQEVARRASPRLIVPRAA
jgi:hypothetical protein